MVSLLLVIHHPKEQSILKMAFQQRGVQVVEGKPGYEHYVKILQFSPDFILIELPKYNHNELKFAKLLATHKRMSKTPILGYGDPIISSIKRGIMQQGFLNYYDRPLRFSQLLVDLEKLLKKKNKKLDTHEEVKDKKSDTALLLDPQTKPMQKLKIISNYVEKMLAFPFTVSKVLSITASAKTGAGDLAKAIEVDPVISANILRLSNTVLFASSNHRIASVKEAIVRIGFNEIKKIAMAMSVVELFDNKRESLGFDRMHFWYHSLAVGIISAKIAKFEGKINTEEAFLVGLLHDFGVIVLDEFFPEILFELLKQTTDSNNGFTTASIKTIGITQYDIVGDLFPRWKIPDHLVNAISQLNQIQATVQGDKNPSTTIAMCVHVANIVAKSLFIGKECDQFLCPVDHEIFSQLRLLSGITPQFIENITNEINFFADFLGLKRCTFPLDEDIPCYGKELHIALLSPKGLLFNPLSLAIKQKKFKVKSFSHDVDSNKLQQKFDLILIWDEAETFEHIESILSLSAKTQSEQLPVFWFTPNQTQSDVARICSFPISCDYRLVEMKIAETCAAIQEK